LVLRTKEGNIDIATLREDTILSKKEAARIVRDLFFNENGELRTDEDGDCIFLA
jgi:hypothetical protein